MKQIQIWKFLSLFLGGIIIGMVLLILRDQDPSSPHDKQDLPKEATVVSHDGLKSLINSPVLSPDSSLDAIEDGHNGQTLLRGDRYLVGGNYALALDNYRALETTLKQSDAALLLRKAICYERQSKFSSAESLYRKAIQTASHPSHQLIAIIGFSRVLAQDRRVDEAINLLSEQVLLVDRADTISNDIRSLLVFQYAKTLERKAILLDQLNRPHNSAPIDLTSPKVLSANDRLPVPELVLAMIDNTLQTKPDKPSPRLAENFSIQQRPTATASTISGSASFSITPVGTVLKSITTTAGLDVQLSPNAFSAIKGRSRAVKIRSATLATLLDQLLVSFDLFWHQEGDTIHVVTSGEVTERAAEMDFVFESAKRAFRRFDVDFPESVWRQSSLLSRAGLALTQGMLDEAGNLFKELEQTRPVNGIQASLFFNQAKLSLLLNRKKEAKSFLYLAIDQSVDPNIEASSYCLLSGLHLSDGEIDEAVKTGRRGLSTAVTNQQKQIAVLNSSRAYLLKNDPFSANTTIFDHHEFVTDPTNRKIAAMLGSFARFSGLADSRHGDVARNRLLNALSSMSNDDFQTFHDCYLAGMAYDSLGFQDHAIKMLTLAISRSDAGTWQRRAIFELGMLQKKAGLSEESQTTFRTLEDVDDLWRTKALHQIAIVYQTTNQTDLCIETCRKLWQTELDESLKIPALQLLGRAFQEKGEHHSAALCFAGMIPDEF